MNVFGFERVYRVKRNPAAVLVIKNSGMYCGGSYTVTIDLPGSFYKNYLIQRSETDGVLMITLPKLHKGMWIHTIRYTWEFN